MRSDNTLRRKKESTCRCRSGIYTGVIHMYFRHLNDANVTTDLQPKDEKLGIVAGQMLPNRGRCSHYSKSYRWFRCVVIALHMRPGLSRHWSAGIYLITEHWKNTDSHVATEYLHVIGMSGKSNGVRDMCTLLILRWERDSCKSTDGQQMSWRSNGPSERACESNVMVCRCFLLFSLMRRARNSLFTRHLICHLSSLPLSLS